MYQCVSPAPQESANPDWWKRTAPPGFFPMTPECAPVVPAPGQFAQLQHISPLPQSAYYGPVDPQAFSGMVMRYAAPHSQLKRSHRERDPYSSVAKGRIAAQRRRDSQGKFLKKEVALRLEELESKLQAKTEECFSLRKSLEKQEQQMEKMKRALNEQRLLNARLLQARQPSYAEGVPVNLTSRNYAVGPTTNPYANGFISESQKPFTEKIDYSKLLDGLRKTDSRTMNEEKKEVISLQEEWEQQQQFQAFVRKYEEEQRWRNLLEAEKRDRAEQEARLQTIYQQPGKIGNQMVPAFTTKVDLTTAREGLGKARTRDGVKNGEAGGSGAPRELHMEHMKAIMREVEQRHLAESTPDVDVDMLMSPEWERMLSPASAMDIEPPSRHTLGGAPSNIYTPPAKIGNLPVKAFTSKIDLSEIELRKTGLDLLSTSPPL